MDRRNPHMFAIDGRNVSVYISKNPNSPVIYLNTFEGEGGQVYQILQESGCHDFTLAVISGLSWNHDMSPWAIPPITKKDMPCTGGADAYLQVLTEEIMPVVEQLVPGKVLWRGLAGYSLAGLFALYAPYQSEKFTRIASVSGSFWFPRFQEYILENQMKVIPEVIYFSLGDKEYRTSHPYMKTVQKRTEEIVAFYQEKEIDTIYERNPGNHFQDAVQRMVSGIAWILGR